MSYAALEGPLFHVRAMRGRDSPGNPREEVRLKAGRCGNPELRDDAPRILADPGVAAKQHLGGVRDPATSMVGAK